MSEPKQDDYAEVFGNICDGCAFEFSSDCPEWVKCGERKVKYRLKTDTTAITALFEQILVEHIAASELRDLYRHKLREILG